MTGETLRVDVKYNDRKIVKYLREIEKRGKDPEPALKDIGESLLISTEQRFVDQVDPSGNQWEALDPDYQRRKKKNQDLILVLENYLKTSFTYNTTRSSLDFGTNKVQAATHQFGDDDRNIPARPFLGLSDWDVVEILDILHDYYDIGSRYT